jgi:hypothetical protein
MAQLLGKDAAFKIATVTVAQMAEWALNIASENVGEAEFGDDWDRTVGSALLTWTATVSGFASVTDSNGQDVLEAAALLGTKLTTLRFYVDATNYWTSDTGTDATAGAFIESWNITAPRGGVVGIEITIKGTGPLHKTS